MWTPEQKREYYREYAKKRYNSNPEKARNYAREWRAKHKEIVNFRQRKRYRKNREAILEYHRIYNKLPASVERRRRWRKNNERYLSYKRDWQRKYGKTLAGRTYANSYRQKRLKNNPSARIAKNLSSRIVHAIKNQKTWKSKRSIELLGAPIENVRSYLEQRFRNGMSWDNYGQRTWHIDHIRPLSSFDLTKTEEQLKAFHYTNLQPLWAKENLVKGNKI